MSQDLFEHVLRKAQDCLSETPTIIIGSGASVDYGIPSMQDLGAEAIAFAKNTSDLTLEQISELESKILNDGFETAIDEFDLAEDVRSGILKAIWALIEDADSKILGRLTADNNILALTRLYQHLFSSTHRTIDVISLNYDRLAEYAAEAAGYAHYTGFNYGYLRKQAASSNLRIYESTHQIRTVRIWKVHGSIDWFKTDDGRVLSVDDKYARSHLTPLIVTPGSEKYRSTHQQPFRSIINNSDASIDSAQAFLIVGYGFNDEHIQPKLIDSIQQRNTPIIVLVKKLTSSGRRLLLERPIDDYLILESDHTTTRVHCSDFDGDDMVIPDSNIWNLDSFLTKAISR